MTLETLETEAHGNSERKGFWDEISEAQAVGDQVKFRALVNEKLMLVNSELVEAMDELRSGHTVSEVYEGENGKPEGFAVEIADAIIRLFDLTGGLNVGVVEIIEKKMAYNSASRGHLHGRSF